MWSLNGSLRMRYYLTIFLEEIVSMALLHSHVERRDLMKGLICDTIRKYKNKHQ